MSGFVAFSLVASSIYIVNDIKDRHHDKLHPKKRLRPIAAGTVSVREAVILALCLVSAAGAILCMLHASWLATGLICFYAISNIAYSFGLKNVPIVDVFILSLGFVVRVYFGAAIIGVEVSKWLYLAILAFSFYLSLGKRRNEIIANGSKTRKVNKYYTEAFLDKNMYVCLGLTLMYYSLWSVDPSQKHKLIVFTVPLVILIVMAYSLRVENSDSDGDPVSVVLGNKTLLALMAAYGFIILTLVYL